MKTCAICGHVSDAETCPNCGEASWLPEAPKRKPEPKPEADEAPASAPASEKISKKRGRK